MMSFAMLSCLMMVTTDKKVIEGCEAAMMMCFNPLDSTKNAAFFEEINNSGFNLNPYENPVLYVGYKLTTTQLAGQKPWGQQARGYVYFCINKWHFLQLLAMHLTLLVGATIRYLPDNIPTEEWGTAIYDASNMLDPRVTLMWFFDAAGRRATAVIFDNDGNVQSTINIFVVAMADVERRSLRILTGKLVGAGFLRANVTTEETPEVTTVQWIHPTMPIAQVKTWFKGWHIPVTIAESAVTPVDGPLGGLND